MVFGGLDSKQSGNWIELRPGLCQGITVLRRLRTERFLKVVPKSGYDDRFHLFKRLRISGIR